MKQIFGPIGVTQRRWATCVVSLFVLVMVCLLASSKISAQSANASLSGTVQDTTGAVIPNAEVTLTNTRTKFDTKVKSNGEEFFNFSGIGPGTYIVSITATGFEKWKLSAFDLNPGDAKALASVKLKIGAAETTVVVEASRASVIEQTGERSSLITSGDMDHLATVGRNATELVKMLPGFAMAANGSLTNSSGYDPSSVGFNSAVGNYAAAGAPVDGGIGLVSDGTSVIDPGNMGGSTQDINMDMTSELKVSTSNFGADSSKGPVVITAVGKSGSSEYHGEGYFHARNYNFNSVDWLTKASGAAAPQDYYYYPGGNVGGPVKIPGTNFNHSKKLLFWGGYEYYDQLQPGSLLETVTPTPAMRAGHFDINSLSDVCQGFKIKPSQSYIDSNGANGAQNTAGPLYCQTPDYTPASSSWGNPTTYISNGDVSSYIDSSSKLFNLYPSANITPSAANGYNNYAKMLQTTYSGQQFRVRVDYNLSDNNKLYANYSRENITGSVPQNLYYSPSNTLPYAGNVTNPMVSHTVGANWTHVFNSTLTNELYGGYTHFVNPYTLTKPSAVTQEVSGITVGSGLFGTTSSQMPAIVDWVGGGYPSIFMMGFPNGGKDPVNLVKSSLNIGENLTKVWKTHTLKAGFYFETSANSQTNTDVWTQGQLTYYPWTFEYNALGAQNGWAGCTDDPTASTAVCFNPVANALMGAPDSFQQTNIDATINLAYRTIAFYATDSWKVTKKLTFDFGLRVDHLGPWYDRDGYGFAVFDPALYTAETGSYQTDANVNDVSVTQPGMKAHKVYAGSGVTADPSLPLTGFNPRLFFYEPRFGFSYDFYGNGHTVFRGGWGEYRFHDSWNDFSGASSTVKGQITPSALTNSNGVEQNTWLASSSVNNIYAAAAPNAQGGTPYAVSTTDKAQPLTQSYNFTVDQQLPKKVDLELGYTGNLGKSLYTRGSLSNINALDYGGLWTNIPAGLTTPYCNVEFSNMNANAATCSFPSGATKASALSGLTTAQQDMARQYPYYHQVNIYKHTSYSNYNALVVSLAHNTGSFFGA